jgi:hypothetical protein
MQHYTGRQSDQIYCPFSLTRCCSAQQGSTQVLELLLNTEGCDVDIQNRLTKGTPLHLAVILVDLELRHYVVQSLLEAGADTKYAPISCSLPFTELP